MWKRGSIRGGLKSILLSLWSPYIQKHKGHILFKRQVIIILNTDKVALYKEAGLTESFDSSKWISHHVSYNSNTGMMEMQLVSLEAHKQSHIGGVHDFETHHGVKYNTERLEK